MPEKSIFGLSCDEAVIVCDKTCYKEAGFLKKLQLKIHLFFCRNCKNYNRRNMKLNHLVQKAEIKSCSAKEKEKMRERLKNNS